MSGENDWRFATPLPNCSDPIKGASEHRAALACFAAMAACRQGGADPHPVHARNCGLLSAWAQWARQLEAEPGEADAAMFLNRSQRRYADNDERMQRILLRKRSPATDRQFSLDAIEGDAMFATAALMFWGRPNTLLELTPALEQLLADSDLGEDIPAAQLRAPVPACYIRFGATMRQQVMLPAQDGFPAHHIEGAYVFEAACNGKRAVSIVAVYVVGKHEPMGISSLDFVVEDEREALLGLVRRQCAASAQSPPLLAQQIALTQLCMKVFLYWSLEQARHAVLTPYSEALRRLQSMGPKKAAKLRRQMAHLYDRVLLGRPALPLHLRGAGGAVSPHWRRGHFRMQAHGPLLSLRKVIFIAPVLVRADRLASDELA